MKSKFYLLIVFSIIIPLFFTQKTYAQEKASGSSAMMEDVFKKEELDKRVVALKKYLEKNNSPLASSSAAFVKEADKYNFDWRLVAAISGVESSFGLYLPNKSYNAWGWGIYGNNVTYFSSFDDGIRTISQNLREKYMDKWKAKDVYQIGRFYAASPTWPQRVVYFMNQIEKFQKEEESKNPPVTL